MPKPPRIPDDLKKKLLADLKAEVAFVRHPVCPRCGKIPARYGDRIRCDCRGPEDVWEIREPLPHLDVQIPETPAKHRGGRPPGKVYDSVIDDFQNLVKGMTRKEVEQKSKIKPRVQQRIGKKPLAANTFELMAIYVEEEKNRR